MKKSPGSSGVNGKKPKPERRRRTQAERSESTRARILEASAEILRQKGVAGLRTLEVAAKAGVSQGAQFHHFPNKRELLIATLRWINEESMTRSRARAEKGFGDDEDLISGIIADAADFYFSDGFFTELAIGLNGQEEREFLDEIRNITREARVSVDRAWRDSLQNVGLTPEVSADVVSLTLSLVRGYAVRTLIDDDRSEFARLFQLWREIVMDYIKKKSAAAKSASNTARRSR